MKMKSGKHRDSYKKPGQTPAEHDDCNMLLEAVASTTMACADEYRVTISDLAIDSKTVSEPEIMLALKHLGDILRADNYFD